MKPAAFDPSPLAQRPVVLGDQSPWAGGLLRAQALQQHGIAARYFWQDLDAPWVETAEKPAICHSWPPYWSLACRYPFSASMPDWQCADILNLSGSPAGLGWLSGPHQQLSLAAVAQQARHPALSLLQKLLQAELDWAQQLAQWRATPYDKISLPPHSTLWQLVQSLCHASGVAVAPFSQLFAAEKPLLYHDLPAECFWHLDADGKRHPAPCAGSYPVPRALALVLECAARGWVLACTRLPYLDQVLALRQRHLPGLKIALLHVEFDWQAGPLLPLVFETCRQRRQRRGRSWQAPTLEQSAHLDAWWRQRPSSLSLQVLGGRLTSQIRYQEY